MDQFVVARRAELAAQRAPLRRPPRPRQEGDHPAARPRAGAALAAQLRRAAAAGRARRAPSTRRTIPRYRLFPPDMLPASECLKDVVVRVLPYWYDRDRARSCSPGLNVLVTAHGNSLRALLKHFEDVGDDGIAEVNVPTGAPKQYRFDDALNVLSAEYLGDAAPSSQLPPPLPLKPAPPEQRDGRPCKAGERPRSVSPASGQRFVLGGRSVSLVAGSPTQLGRHSVSSRECSSGPASGGRVTEDGRSVPRVRRGHCESSRER